MRALPRWMILALAAPLAWPAPLGGHMVLLLPDRPALRLRQEASLLLALGHPFECEFEDLAAPRSLVVLGPSGPPRDLLPALKPERWKSPRGTEVQRFRAVFQPSERGDYLVAAAFSPRLEGESTGLVEDFAKALVHVQAERGWDRAVGHPLEVLPLTRPYGLRPGVSFQARVILGGQSFEGAEVEVERYNPTPPAALPESVFITRTARTGPGGLLTSTLDEAGWWVVSVSARQGTRLHEGKERPLTLRSTLWVYVGEPLEASR